MRQAVLVVAVVGLMGCPGASTCETNADCDGGEVCDTRYKLCVFPPDSGAVGGGAQGGGGGAIGGGSGGSGGGAVVDTGCRSACADWETCQPGDGGSGTCRAALVKIQSPANGTAFGVSASVTITATVRDWDGGVWPKSQVPTSTGSGVVQLTANGVVFQGGYTMPATHGNAVVRVGWLDSGVAQTSDSVTLSAQDCKALCADWQECVPDSDGGTCLDQLLTLKWLAPTGVPVVAKNSTVTLTLSVTRADGGFFSKAVPFWSDAGAAGNLMPVGGVWDASVQAPNAEAMPSVTAGWPGGGPTWVTTQYHVDGTPPTLGLVIPSDGGAYQRDAVIPAVVTANETVTGTTLTVGGTTFTASTKPTVDCPAYATTPDASGCYLVDFSQPTLNALDGGFTVTLGGTDVFGNAGTNGAAALPVTRVRWKVRPAARQVQALTVGSTGILYVGTATVPDAGELCAVTAATGASRCVGGGSIESLATAPSTVAGVTGDIVYAAYNVGDNVKGSIGAFESTSLTTGTILALPCQGAASSQTYSGIALFKNAANYVAALGAINAVAADGRACIYDPKFGPTQVGTPGTTFDAPKVPVNLSTGANVIIQGTTASFLHQETSGTGDGAYWQPVTTLTGTPMVGTSEQLNTFSANPATGQALSGGTFVVSTVNAGGQKQVFLKGASSGQGALGPDSNKGVVVLVSAAEAYVGSGTSLVQFSLGDLSNPTATLRTIASDSFLLSPVLGATKGGVAEGYAVSGNGNLVVFRQGTGAFQWQASLGGTVATHPTMDCNRATASATTGVLYVGDATGNVTAIIVDSPKISTTALWPKYQRSAGNAGNDDTANFPTNWPGCPQ